MTRSRRRKTMTPEERHRLIQTRYRIGVLRDDAAALMREAALKRRAADELQAILDEECPRVR